VRKENHLGTSPGAFALRAPMRVFCFHDRTSELARFWAWARNISFPLKGVLFPGGLRPQFHQIVPNVRKRGIEKGI
jgi:hypothetical protein